MANEKNIINSELVKKHLIKKYTFKVLSSNSSSSSSKTEEKNSCEDVAKDIINDEDMGHEVEESKAKEIKDSFITELLQKSDKMSSDIIKLQLQMEEGQKEFESRLEKETKDAYEKGKKDGYDEAKKEIQAEINKIKEQYLNSIVKIDKLFDEFKNYMDSLKDELPKVSFEIAQEVIAKEIEKNSKDIAYTLANKLIEDIKNANKIEIKTNEKDYEYLKEKFADRKNIEISTDDAISEGGVILLSEIGNIDGDIKTRVQKVKQLLDEK